MEAINYTILFIIVASFIYLRYYFKNASSGIDTCSGMRFYKDSCEIDRIKYVLAYKNSNITQYSDCLEHLYHNFISDYFEIHDEDPIEIKLPDGRNIPYNNYVFHKWFDHGGQGSENDLIKFLLEVKNEHILQIS